jgi:hypothetical protein
MGGCEQPTIRSTSGAAGRRIATIVPLAPCAADAPEGYNGRMMDRRRDVNLAQGIVVAVLTALSAAIGFLLYRNVADALRAAFQGLVVSLFTTGLFIMVIGMLSKRKSGD